MSEGEHNMGKHIAPNPGATVEITYVHTLGKVWELDTVTGVIDDYLVAVEPDGRQYLHTMKLLVDDIDAGRPRLVSVKCWRIMGFEILEGK